MRRVLVTISLLMILAALACQALTLAVPAPTATASATVTNILPSQTLVPSPLPATATKTPAPPAIPTTTEAPFLVQLHPDGGLYIGDLISFEVLAPPGVDLSERQLSIRAGDTDLVPVPFAPYGIARRLQATLRWAWDTTGLDPGTYELIFSIGPEGASWTLPVELQPRADMRYPEPFAAWQVAQSRCCTLHYASHTAAERDLPEILAELDRQAARAAEQMQIDFAAQIDVVLLPRVLGHGGFASNEIAVSYLDRNYANNNLGQVIHHEMIHILDGRLPSKYRPSLFVEGLAVYLSQGHYKREPLLARAAVLDELGWYLALAPLADDFYNSQHEVGYLQAGALIQYMVATWGWEAFDDFYRDIEPPTDSSPSQVIDAALQVHFGLSLEELEMRFLNVLRAQPLIPDLREDVILTVRYYDTLRSYQQALDPSAYFLTAWLLPGQEMRERGIVADYLRRPNLPENLALETMLVAAGDAIFFGVYDRGYALLAAVDAVLEARAVGDSQLFRTHPLALDYYQVVAACLARGMEPQRVEFQNGIARAWVTAAGLELLELELVSAGERWEFMGQ
jgi:hypothetical protein